MDYNTGDTIPETEVLKRLKDTAGNIYLELKKDKISLYQIGENNLLYYKVDRSENIDDMEVLVDYSGIAGYVDDAEDDTGQGEGDEAANAPQIEPDEDVTVKINVRKLKKKLNELTFEEGEPIPHGLRDKCNQNAYGGYSLTYNNYSYVLDADFTVQIKRSNKQPSSFALEAENDNSVPGIGINNHSSNSLMLENNNGLAGVGKGRDLEKGDILPEHMRDHCEVDLSAGGGYRIQIGDNLYILDEHFCVVVKMSQSYHGDDIEEAVNSRPKQINNNSIPNAQPQQQQHSPEKIVLSVIKKFAVALKFDQLEVDLFVEEVLKAPDRSFLIEVLQGDLSRLNEEIKAAARAGRKTKVDLEGDGISLLKAALVHELYMKSTARSRGEKIIEFLSHIISPWKDSQLTLAQADLNLAGQGNLIDFVDSQSMLYPDIRATLQRVMGLLRDIIRDDYNNVKKGGKTLFKSFLIDKLYQMISRPEKGNGVSLIGLVRSIMDFQA